MANQTNPNLKFKRLTDEHVLELMNQKACDAQWNVNNAKSPKGIRDAQDELNLFASAVEFIKRLKNDAYEENLDKTALEIFGNELPETVEKLRN